MTDEELKKKREEKLKIREEGDRNFFVRLGRFALLATVFTIMLFLPVFAVWRTFEQDYPYSFFWSNLGWLLWADLFAMGALVIISITIYLAGGLRGLKLCGADEFIDDKNNPVFLLMPILGCMIYVILFACGTIGSFIGTALFG